LKLPIPERVSSEIAGVCEAPRSNRQFQLCFPITLNAMKPPRTELRSRTVWLNSFEIGVPAADALKCGMAVGESVGGELELPEVLGLLLRFHGTIVRFATTEAKPSDTPRPVFVISIDEFNLIPTGPRCVS